MSKASEILLSRTSKPQTKPALLLLADGTAFIGSSVGAPGEVFGEICFNTSLEGYLEVLTDPSYAGQIVVMTYPQIGNYGVNEDDIQAAAPALSGFVVRDMCHTPSNWRSTMSLPDYLKAQGIVAIEGIDTRALVRHIRDHGAQMAALSTLTLDQVKLAAALESAADYQSINYVARVSRAESSIHELKASTQDFAKAAPLERRFKVVAYDCGAKNSILNGLATVGCDVVVVPWNTSAAEVLAQNPDGVFVSNGPGDPDQVEETARQVRALVGQVPLFGICLGHQMLCKACGASMDKLPFGHHGGNQPVENLLTGRVEITAQNHGFGLDFPSLGSLIPELSGGYATHVDDLRFWAERDLAPVVDNKTVGRIQLTHVNLNDGTPEGIACLDARAFSVQYHPEATPGPTDAHYLFTAFTRLMAGDPDYLDIDIARDRLNGWRFGSLDQ